MLININKTRIPLINLNQNIQLSFKNFKSKKKINIYPNNEVLNICHKMKETIELKKKTIIINFIIEKQNSIFYLRRQLNLAINKNCKHVYMFIAR